MTTSDTNGRNSSGNDGSDRSPSTPDIASTPTDIGDDVRADLEHAFERDSTRLRIKDDATGLVTGPVPGPVAGPVVDDDPEPRETEQTVPQRPHGKRKRRFRSILEIAHDYDTRIKNQGAVITPAKTSSRAKTETSSTPVTTSPISETEVVDSHLGVTDIGLDDDPKDHVLALEIEEKKRVVITDDTIDVDRMSPESRRAARRRKRRFWSRQRSEQDDELSRLRKQRRASQRIDGRWRPRWYTVVGGLIALIVILLLLLTSPLLAIKQVDVEGNVYADAEALSTIIGNLEGDPILTADLHGAKEQIEALPWVRKARVTMHLPSRILIQIDERSPLAFVRSVDGFNRVLDRDGRVLDVIEGDPVDYIRIIGTAPTLVAGDFVSQPFLGAAQLINALPRDLSERLVSATVSPEGEISLQFNPNLQVIFGAPADYQAKLVGVINEIKRQGTKSYTVIDVSSGEPNVR